jgi:hypothetical protein
MKGIIAVALLVWVASQVVSWAAPPKYELVTQWHQVKAGETIWSISCDYFDEQERYNNMNEWSYWVRKANEHELKKTKFLQIGTVLAIPVEKKVK